MTLKKTGSEKFHINGKNLDNSMLDFWQWSSLDVVNNPINILSITEYEPKLIEFCN